MFVRRRVVCRQSVRPLSFAVDSFVSAHAMARSALIYIFSYISFDPLMAIMCRGFWCKGAPRARFSTTASALSPHHCRFITTPSPRQIEKHSWGILPRYSIRCPDSALTDSLKVEKTGESTKHTLTRMLRSLEVEMTDTRSTTVSGTVIMRRI